jgi:hypothetical protein
MGAGEDNMIDFEERLNRVFNPDLRPLSASLPLLRPWQGTCRGSSAFAEPTWPRRLEALRTVDDELRMQSPRHNASGQYI